MTLSLRRAVLDDAGAIHRLIELCGLALAADGFHNWSPPASRSSIEKDIEQREVYLATERGDVVGTVTVATEPTVPYADLRWALSDAPALYVNRLAVLPDLQGRGIGAWLTERMEARARELGCATVRLDALADNRSLCSFYDRAGYELRFEREHSGWRFACYEKMLKGPKI